MLGIFHLKYDHLCTRLFDLVVSHLAYSLNLNISYTNLRIKYYYKLRSLRVEAAFHAKVILMSYTQFSISQTLK